MHAILDSIWHVWICLEPLFIHELQPFGKPLESLGTKLKASVERGRGLIFFWIYQASHFAKSSKYPGESDESHGPPPKECT